MFSVVPGSYIALRLRVTVCSVPLSISQNMSQQLSLDFPSSLTVSLPAMQIAVKHVNKGREERRGGEGGDHLGSLELAC